eukprot:TRINITY_DN1861_c0_g1_i1.p1 TRINITY_DN1861_c0_g1~~TRINITY_DN1861_c0_g1_i1.p1  ORF type:complete len:402 (+),score=75.30 TRINITY_DN1861_c0_g1_i1:42-1247(+)
MAKPEALSKSNGVSSWTKRHAIQPTNPIQSERASSDVHVHKFGGTSVRNAECFANVRDIILHESETDATLFVVVSAPKGITNQLLELCDPDVDNEERKKLLSRIEDRISEILKGIAPDNTKVQQYLEEEIQDIYNLCSIIPIMGTCPEKIRSWIAVRGEYFSTHLLSTLFPNALMLDAKDFITIRRDEGNIDVDWEATEKKFTEILPKTLPKLTIVPGFVCGNQEGATVCLERDGSDWTATIVGALLNASAVNIWTDVNGVYTADPRSLRTAKKINFASFHEIAELTANGCTVIQRNAVKPARQCQISVIIRNTFNREDPGTLIMHSKKRELSTQRIAGVCATDCVILKISHAERSAILAKPLAALASISLEVLAVSSAGSDPTVLIAVHSKYVFKSETSG